MTETPFAGRMKEIVAGLHPTLTEAGFRKQRHTFNRETEPGVVQVVNFQMGAHLLGEEIPSLRANLHGRFTVNLGTFISEISELSGQKPPGAFVHEYHCQIRKRLGELVRDPQDYWWNLGEPARSVVETLDSLIRINALPWLDSIRTRAAILDQWHEQGLGLGFPPSGPLLVALMLLHAGHKAEATEIVEKYVQQPQVNPHHLEFVARLLDRVGLDVEVPATRER